MSATSAEEQHLAILEYLLTDLTPEARRVWDARPDESLQRQPELGLHDVAHARLGAVSRSLRRTKEGLPLHAACCTLPDGRGVLIAGATGSGKSTLSAVLGVSRGATLVSDDTVWLTGARATSLGAPVALRPGSPFWDRARALWYADDSARLLARAVDLGIPAFHPSGPLDVLLLPTHGADRGGLRAVSAAEAFCHLAGSLLRECSPAELDELARLAGRLPAAAISYVDAAESIELCAQFFDTAVERPRVEPTRLRSDDLQRSGLCRDVMGMRFHDEVALWRPPAGEVVYVRHWNGGSLWKTPAQRPLEAAGFLERKAEDERHGPS